MTLPLQQEAIQAKCFHESRSFIAFTKEEIDQSIPDRFEKIVAKYPHRLAIKAGDRSLTYAELNQQANRIAHAIVERRGLGGEPIAIMCEDRIREISAILAVLKAGKFFVPSDVSYPKDRNSYFLRDSSAAMIICDAQGVDKAIDTAANVDVVGIDDLDSHVSDEDLQLSIPPEAFAYIMYTSGSTGEPKGIIENHENILHDVMCYTNKLHVCKEDRLTLLHSLSFRSSELNFYGALLNGGAIVPYDIKRDGIAHLARWLSDERITIFHSIPSVFRLLSEHLTEPEKTSTVRLVHLSGAPVAKRDVELWEKHFLKPCLFLHRMGTTETGNVSWRLIERSSDIPGNKLPLGWAPDGKQVSIVDEKGEEVGVDQVGEITVKSRYISPGYWNKPQMTKAKFLPVLNGTGERIYRTGDLGYQNALLGLFHLGRKDFQIKIRGYRVESSEVEAALAEHFNVKEAAVMGYETDGRESCLAGYVVPVDKSRSNVSELRSFLKARLPDYMVPSVFVFLDALPLTPNGKVDHNALPKPGRARPELATAFVAARSQLEESLAGIVGEVLSLDQVGVHDNFFELGGHSLAATRVVSRVLQRYQLQIPLQALFESVTVAEMARVVSKYENIKRGAMGLEEVLKDLESLSDIEAEQMLDREKSKKVSRP